MYKWLVIVLIAFANAWIWRIFKFNFPLFILLILLTIILNYLIIRKITRKLLVFFVILLGIVTFFQWKTTTPQSLTLLDNDEQRIKQERLQYYNPSSHYMRILFARLDLKNFLEGDLNIASTKLQRNFFETIDPNVYFFAGHPRERVWANDFEKFPFILIAPFLVGLYQIIKKKNRFIFSYFLASLILITLIGHKNTMGPFILFPLFVICIRYGLLKILKNET